MKERFYRFKNSIILSASKVVGYYKYYLLVFFILFLTLFITGIMTCSKYASDVTCENLINKYLYSFLKKDISLTSIFLIMSVYFILISIFFMLFTKHTFFIVVDVVALSLMAYIFGFDLCIIVISLGFSGVVLGIMSWGIIGIVLFFDMILILSIACRRLKENKNTCNIRTTSEYIKIYILLMVLGVALIFLMCFLFSIIHIFVIVE